METTKGEKTRADSTSEENVREGSERRRTY